MTKYDKIASFPGIGMTLLARVEELVMRVTEVGRLYNSYASVQQQGTRGSATDQVRVPAYYYDICIMCNMDFVQAGAVGVGDQSGGGEGCSMYRSE
jgi:hypothetical protein